MKKTDNSRPDVGRAKERKKWIRFVECCDLTLLSFYFRPEIFEARDDQIGEAFFQVQEEER